MRQRLWFDFCYFHYALETLCPYIYQAMKGMYLFKKRSSCPKLSEEIWIKFSSFFCRQTNVDDCQFLWRISENSGVWWSLHRFSNYEHLKCVEQSSRKSAKCLLLCWRLGWFLTITVCSLCSCTECLKCWPTVEWSSANFVM